MVKKNSKKKVAVKVTKKKIANKVTKKTTNSKTSKKPAKTINKKPAVKKQLVKKPIVKKVSKKTVKTQAHIEWPTAWNIYDRISENKKPFFKALSYDAIFLLLGVGLPLYLLNLLIDSSLNKIYISSITILLVIFSIGMYSYTKLKNIGALSKYYSLKPNKKFCIGKMFLVNLVLLLDFSIFLLILLFLRKYTLTFTVVALIGSICAFLFYSMLQIRIIQTGKIKTIFQWAKLLKPFKRINLIIEQTLMLCILGFGLMFILDFLIKNFVHFLAMGDAGYFLLSGIISFIILYSFINYLRALMYGRVQ